MRPLISTGDPKKSVDISRKAELYETSSGMLTITGGKLTTWRRMAKQAVDRLVEREGREAPCRTAEIPLGMPATEEDLATGLELPEAAAEQLAFRYGHAARSVLAIAAERPELAEPIVPGRPDLLAEVVLAARAEQARSVADVLLRRTRLGLLAAPDLRDGTVATRMVAELLGGSWAGVSGSPRRPGDTWRGVAEREGLDPAASARGHSRVSPAMRRVLVSGTKSGFLGGFVCRELSQRGHEPVGLCRLRGSAPSGRGRRRANQRQRRYARFRAVRQTRPDRVIHRRPEDRFRAAQRGGQRGQRSPTSRARTPFARRLASEHRGTRTQTTRFLFASTVVTGDAKGELLDEDTELPVETAYGRSKQEGERLVRESGLDARDHPPLARLRGRVDGIRGRFVNRPQSQPGFASR